MTNKTCQNCDNWDQLLDLNAGNCDIQGPTAAGFYCDHWVPMDATPMDATPMDATPTRKKPVKAAAGKKPFDIEAACNKVLAAYNTGKISSISITSAQRILRRPYSIAQRVIDHLIATGRIR